MDIDGRTIWQHAAGDRGHDHSEQCWAYDLVVTGQEPDTFNKQMKEGDIVVLKVGTKEVRGVGILGGPIDGTALGAFGDLDGWTLPYGRRVSWLWRGAHRFSGRPLTRATTQRLWSETVNNWLEEAVPNPAKDPSGFAALPKDGSPVSRNVIAKRLFDRGVGSDSIRSLLDPDGEFMRIAKWYDGWRWGNSPSERETVTHLVVPFLRILGWTPPRIALEFNGMDVALLSGLARTDDSAPRDGVRVDAVIEAKKVREPCLSWAAKQATSYANRQGGVLRVIVTDGLRYGVYWRTGPHEDFGLGAYLNLIRPRDQYAIYGCSGAIEAIWAMTPDWRPER